MGFILHLWIENTVTVELANADMLGTTSLCPDYRGCPL